MRSFARIALATSLTLALIGCGGAAQQQDAATDDNQAEGTEQVEEQTEDASTETPKSGGWQVNGDITGTTLTEEQLKVFQKATAELDGVDYEPVAVIGQQVVAGMNYAYLCKATVVAPDAKPTWDVVVVYADLEGNATFTSANEIDLADLKVTDESTTEATGAWAVPEPTDGVSLPGNADDAFDTAIAELSKGVTGYVLAPQALLGTQVVAGTNYKVLCLGCPAADTGNDSFFVYIMTIYQNLQGNVEVTSMEVLDLPQYIEQ